MKTNVRTGLILFFFCVTVVSCSENYENPKVEPADCSTVFCTEEFRFVNILVRHSSDSSAVILTDYKVIRISDNTDITHHNNIMPENHGYYPIVDDSDRDWLRKNNVEVEFQGYIDNNLLIRKRLVVTADCCHVSLVSGETAIYI